MSRLLTPFVIDYPDDVVYSPSEIGPGSLIPWRLDLSTNAGRKQFDVAIASFFRILTWDLHGTLGGDTLNETQTNTVPVANGFGDEREFTSYGIEPDVPNQLRLITGASASWGPKVNVEFSVKITQESGKDIGYVSCQFEGSAPVVSAEFSSVQYSIFVYQAGSVTFRVPSWPDESDNDHFLTTPLYSNVSSPAGTFVCTGTTSLPYADSNGDAIWDAATAAMIRNPITSHARI